METALRDSWINALRSGNFQQGNKRLKNNSPETYCYMGVLGSLLEIDLMDACAFGPKLLKQIGLSDDAQNSLIMKSEKGISFNEAADWIENNL